jgi:hypothetical protein
MNKNEFLEVFFENCRTVEAKGEEIMKNSGRQSLEAIRYAITNSKLNYISKSSFSKSEMKKIADMTLDEFYDEIVKIN